MSPERLQGGVEDRRSDIFSFGVLLYEMATGRRPFEGPDAMVVIRAPSRLVATMIAVLPFDDVSQARLPGAG